MLKLEIELDNAAFEDGRGIEIARILRGAAREIEEGIAHGKLWDVNGNYVGDFHIDDD